MKNTKHAHGTFRIALISGVFVAGIVIVPAIATAQPAPIGFTDLIIPTPEAPNVAPARVPEATAAAIVASYVDAASKAGWKLAKDYEVADVRPFFIPEGTATQVILRSYSLNERAVLFITSDKPDVFQRMKKNDLDNYGGKSAFFPAGKITIALIFEKGAPKPNIKLDRIRVLNNRRVNVFTLRLPTSLEEMRRAGSTESAEASADTSTARIETLCGQDNRTRSDDRRIGRLMPVGCTGWLIADNLALTAGHCVEDAMSIIEFQVPPSLPNGATQPAHPNDQYPVIKSTVKMKYSGIGHDWAVFEIDANSNTGKLPGVQQGAKFKLSKNARPLRARVTGFGVDEDPRGTTGDRNGDNQTQQTENSAGQTPTVVYSGDATHDGSYFRYNVDTMGGNSGSPVIDADGDDRPAIAIHTNGGCESGGNYGTAVENEDLRQAIEHFVHDLHLVYVDE